MQRVLLNTSVTFRKYNALFKLRSNKASNRALIDLSYLSKHELNDELHSTRYVRVGSPPILIN